MKRIKFWCEVCKDHTEYNHLSCIRNDKKMKAFVASCKKCRWSGFVMYPKLQEKRHGKRKGDVHNGGW